MTRARNALDTYAAPIGFLPAVWYGLVSLPGRVWGCTVLLESGAIYRNLPPQALAFTAHPAAAWSAQDAQQWDCYGTDYSALEYTYLAGLDVLVRANAQELYGEYLFSVQPVGDGFSLTPEQSKEFSFVALDNGRLTIQPTNHILIRERSFTSSGAMRFPTDLVRQTTRWSCE